jgi:hypothetical protein
MITLEIPIEGSRDYNCVPAGWPRVVDSESIMFQLAEKLASPAAGREKEPLLSRVLCSPPMRKCPSSVPAKT